MLLSQHSMTARAGLGRPGHQGSSIYRAPPLCPAPLLEPSSSGRPAVVASPSRASWLRQHIVQASSAASDALKGPPSDAASLKPKKGGNLLKRTVVGLLLGVCGGSITIAGGWVYAAFICATCYQAGVEYFGFVTADSITVGMDPPSDFSCALTIALSVGMCLVTCLRPSLSGSALVGSAFAVLANQILSLSKPRLSQITTSVFGLFYCGYLCSFWVKLRCLAAPVLNCPWASTWPVALGGVSVWTVGLLSVLTSVTCIAAADTMAYFVGKNFGRTPLISISPRKTVEGAAGGLAGSVAVAVAAQQFVGWPGTLPQAVVLGAAVFVSSIFGDLIESVMKRDAGMKDSSDLIPGHGGLLDRFDSYMFTGAIVYFLTVHAPLYGLL